MFYFYLRPVGSRGGMIGPGDATRRNSLTEKPFHLLLKRTGEHGRIVLLAVRASFTSDQACCIREQKKQPVDCACFFCFFFVELWRKRRGRGEREREGEGERNSWGESRESSDCCKLWEKRLWEWVIHYLISSGVKVYTNVCVCVREREREREKENKRPRQEEKKKQTDSSWLPWKHGTVGAWSYRHNSLWQPYKAAASCERACSGERSGLTLSPSLEPLSQSVPDGEMFPFWRCFRYLTSSKMFPLLAASSPRNIISMTWRV